jgi:hypothetical protein
LVSDLKRLQELVALVLVEGGLVGDQNPVRTLQILHVEDLGIELRRVVDHHQNLGLGVEVSARTIQKLVELEATRIGHL